MESITDLIIAGIMLAIPVAIFFAGFFIIFGELFRTVNAVYTLRFADAFYSFLINNEGYPFNVNFTNNTLPTIVPMSYLEVKGGLAYTSYDPIINEDANIEIYPQEHTYQGVLSGDKESLLATMSFEFGNSYIRKRFSMGDGYDLFMIFPGYQIVGANNKTFGVGILLPQLENNVMDSHLAMYLKFPHLELTNGDTFDTFAGDTIAYEKKGSILSSLLSYRDFSSSGLISSLNDKNDVTPPGAFVSAPVVYSNGSVHYAPLWFMILVNDKIYQSVADYNYFYQKPRVEVYVEALYITPTDDIKQDQPTAVTLIVSLSRWIPDYNKLGNAKIILSYRYGPYKYVTTSYNVDPRDEFFIIPVDWTKSVTEDQLNEYKKFSKDISFDAIVSYEIVYDGKPYIFSTPVKFLIQLKP